MLSFVLFAVYLFIINPFGPKDPHEKFMFSCSITYLFQGGER